MLRQAAWRLAPAIMGERAARYDRALLRRWKSPQIAETFVERHGDRVLHGPLAGLRYWTGGDAPVAKLLGVYEREIAPWITQALANGGPPAFIDLGAADGFYAVGVKTACPNTRVIAFELSATARGELATLASMNHAPIEIRGRATAQSLSALPLDQALVLCDIEGAEADIFAASVVPRLRASTAIVELHERARPGVTSTLLERFSASHVAEIVEGERRDCDEHPELEALPPEEGEAALDEHRSGQMTWVRFVPRATGEQAP